MVFVRKTRRPGTVGHVTSFLFDQPPRQEQNRPLFARYPWGLLRPLKPLGASLLHRRFSIAPSGLKT